MPDIALPHGTVSYREAGSADSSHPPVVFVHGFLVNGSLWRDTQAALAERGVPSYAPDLPLGSHRHPLGEGADLSPRGVARLVIAFMEALELSDVTLVGNDTGGAICQLLLDTDASRVGRVVLTNCDAFDQFPPSPFDKMFKVFRSAKAIGPLMAPTRSAKVRHSAAGFGLLVREPLDPEQTLDWVEPCLEDPAIRADVARFAKAVDPAELNEASENLGAFHGPARLVWGTGDRFFKPEFGRRLADSFADATLVEIEGGRTFVPHDHPGRLAEEIAAMTPAAVR